MKTTIFSVMLFMALSMFVSCCGETPKSVLENDSTVVDTTVVDSVLVDSIAE